MYIDLIENRLSIRTYKNLLLTKEDQAKVNSLINQVSLWRGPFSSSINPFLVFSESTSEQEKIGTYGFVKNGKAYIGASTHYQKNELIDYGYLFEKVILELTKMNLGTVWLGGTFHRSQFKEYTKDDEVIPAITPIGYEDNPSMTEKLIRIAAKSDRRKKISEFVFNQTFQQPLSEKDNFHHQIFRYVQLAPSASNKQPWMFLVDDDGIHLFLERTPRYGEKLPFDIQYLDMGIAIYHLECAFVDLKIDYQMKSYSKEKKHDLYEYIISFVL
jgi:hypothetical protein